MREAEVGFKHIYELDYDEASGVFQHLSSVFPTHPGPPLYQASSIWLKELFRREELDLDRFAAPGYFGEKTDRKMPPSERELFFQLINECQSRCRAILDGDSRHLDARYFLGASYGILGSFTLTIDHSVKGAFSHGKKAYREHSEIIEADKTYYDAYLSVGLYEYIVGNIPWYIKWLTTLIGYRGSKERGYDYLSLAAEKGTFVSDDANVLRMVLYVREKRYEEALAIVDPLHSRFPRNSVLHLNRAQILEKLGRTENAVADYQEILSRAENRVENYGKFSTPLFRFQLGMKFFELKRLNEAIGLLPDVALNQELPEEKRARAYVTVGKILDSKGDRVGATEAYEQVLRLPDTDGSHNEARRFLKEN